MGKASSQKSTSSEDNSGKGISIIFWKKAEQRKLKPETMWSAQDNSERALEVQRATRGGPGEPKAAGLITRSKSIYIMSAVPQPNQ